MRALFGRKVLDIRELKELTSEAKRKNTLGTEYYIDKEVRLTDEEFNKFANNFLADQEWISKEDGGSNNQGYLKCIRVINIHTGEKILVDSEGYTYARYVAIE